MSCPASDSSANQELLSPKHQIARDFAEFAYVVSHDFKAPLRHIREFTKLLIQKLEADIGESEQQYVRFIERNVVQAEDMLDGLLSYSRLNTRCEPFSSFNGVELLEDTLMGLKHAIEGSNAIITQDMNVEIRGDYNQLKQMLFHLIDNSIKFRKPNKTPHVHVAAFKNAGGVIFTVRDDGIGIPTSEFDTIFNMYHQLHERGLFPGCGIGLTLCRKIAQRHGGRIRVESEPGQGTTIHAIIQDNDREQVQ